MVDSVKLRGGKLQTLSNTNLPDLSLANFEESWTHRILREEKLRKSSTVSFTNFQEFWQTEIFTKIPRISIRVQRFQTQSQTGSNLSLANFDKSLNRKLAEFYASEIPKNPRIPRIFKNSGKRKFPRKFQESQSESNNFKLNLKVAEPEKHAVATNEETFPTSGSISPIK